MSYFPLALGFSSRRNKCIVGVNRIFSIKRIVSFQFVAPHWLRFLYSLLDFKFRQFERDKLSNRTQFRKLRRPHKYLPKPKGSQLFHVLHHSESRQNLTGRDGELP